LHPARSAVVAILRLGARAPKVARCDQDLPALVEPATVTILHVAVLAREIARAKIAEIDLLLGSLARGRRPARMVARRWLGRAAKAVLARRYW